MKEVESKPAGSKVVLVTGATRGIGRALAAAAARAGYRVVVNYRSDRNRAEDFVNGLNQEGCHCHAVRADVGISDDVATLVKATITRFGQIDCVVNNAGIGERISLIDLNEATFTRTVHANLTSAFLVSQAAWPHMRAQGGRLVFLSSIAARTGGALSAAYAASKGGTEALMHAYAAALRSHRITANAIAPALIESGMVQAVEVPPTQQMPLERLGTAEEIWPALRMIIETEYLTGQTIHINAGRVMT
jgi:3-oxoacyl-[acyl-carrier protein] reductase